MAAPFHCLVGVVAASRDEIDALRPALELLDRLGCPYEAIIVNPFVAPRQALDWAEQIEKQGGLVILAAAGRAPQLPSFVAAACHLPVVAVPLEGAEGDEGGWWLAGDAAAPVAAVQAAGAQEGALFALRIVALAEPKWGKILRQYQKQIEAEQAEANRELREDWLAEEGEGGSAVEDNDAEKEEEEEAESDAGESTEESEEAADEFEDDDEDKDGDAEDELPIPRLAGKGEKIESKTAQFVDSGEAAEVRPVSFDQPLSGPVVGRAAAPAAGTPGVKVARRLGRRRIDPDTPEVDLIEDAVDCLLEGGVIALPTDTVYGLACDATNPAAVALLSEIKGRPAGKAISLLVDSQKQLGFIATNLTVEIRRLTEAFWPGPLTILFRKRAGNFAHINSGEAVSVRMPDHSTPLAIMQALARPLAFTSAALPGSPEPLSADAVEELHGDRLHLIFDGGPLLSGPPSTVIDVTHEPFKILRHGAVGTDQLGAIVGEKLEGG